MRKLAPLLSLVFVASVVRAGWENPPPGFVMESGKRIPNMVERLRLIKPAKAGELRLVPTYVSCSMYWGVKGEVEGIALEYRVAGAKEWQTAEKPVYFDDAENYRGSIFNLKEDTVYEARIAVGDKIRASGKFRTWRSDVPIARTVVLDPKTARYPIVISDHGTPNGWVRYTAMPGTVLGSDAVRDSSLIVVRNAENVIIEGITMQGGGGNRNSPVFIEKSKGVRVRNCEIFGFGSAGQPVFTEKGGGCFFENSSGFDDSNPGRKINWHAGIMLYPETEEITIERCYIHDPRGHSNAWYYSHPAGMEGIFVYRANGSIVLRWNDIVGSDLHRWNDAIEGAENFSASGGFNRDSDIYGNFCIYSNDDGVELDGGQQNVRCFRNRFESSLTGISIQGCMVSPVYLYENFLAPCCDEFGQGSQCIKTYDFDEYWYAPYAYIRRNWFGMTSYKPVLGMTSRWDWRDDNVFVANDVPAKVARKLPARSLPFMLDVGIIKDVKISGSDASAAKTTVIARSTKPQPYKVRKNFDSDWFTVTPSEGKLKEGDNAFTVTFHPSKMSGRRHWRSAFLVRTPEGLSRCVSVYAEKTDFEQPARPVKSTRTVYVTPDSPIQLSRANSSSDAVDVSFDIAEEGYYWFFVRGTSEKRQSSVRMSVDGSEYQPAFLVLWPDYASWNILRPGAAIYTAKGGLDPFRLKRGRHVLRLQPYKGSSATITDIAVSDQPPAFEPR